jgi:hypothetical protein
VYTTKEAELLVYYFKKNKESMLRMKEIDKMLPDKKRIENREYNDNFEFEINKFPSSSFIGIIVSNSVLAVYAFLIVAHIVNCSLLSLVYPISLFCYALLREPRPSKYYWSFLILYTTIILILKALVKSNLALEVVPTGVNEFFKNFRIGLYNNETGEFSILYYLCDVLILLFVVIHIICLKLQGLFDYNEAEIETLYDAVDRIIKSDKKAQSRFKRKGSFE